MDFSVLVNSNDYIAAKTKISIWNENLKTANIKETIIIRNNIVIFFSLMKKTRPELYALFQGHHKKLSEVVHEKLTRKKTIID